jgi:sensor histidine kinase YesM
MNFVSKNNIQKIWYHVIFWMIYISSEYVVNLPHLNGAAHGKMIRSILLSLPLLLFPAYFLIGYGIPKLLRKNKLFLFIVSIIVIGVIILFGRVKWLELVNYLNSGYTFDMPVGKVLKNVIRDYSVIALIICIHIITDWRQQRIINEKLVQEKQSLNIELLKKQLHPHFLFNTLNNIYSLSLKKSEKTTEGILKLSHLLEYLVYQTGEKEVPFKEEIELVANYIELEKLRYGKHLQVDFKTDMFNESLKTAPLLLLPFVENCFKHGGKNEKGVFWITISIRAVENGIHFFVKNSKSVKSINKVHKGIGLQNIKKRLGLIYKDRYSLTIEDNAYFYETRLYLNLTNENL